MTREENLDARGKRPIVWSIRVADWCWKEVRQQSSTKFMTEDKYQTCDQEMNLRVL